MAFCLPQSQALSTRLQKLEGYSWAVMLAGLQQEGDWACDEYGDKV